jgi:hypothetical protein
MKLRIHHLFDIIRDFGNEVDFKPHNYGHSYHLIAETLIKNPDHKIELVKECDDVCLGCIHNIGHHCDDSIHRPDFPGKEKFNDHIDGRIMQKCNIHEHDSLTLLEILNKADQYLNNIEWIYEGNDPLNTSDRKKNLRKGILKLFQTSLMNFNSKIKS